MSNQQAATSAKRKQARQRYEEDDDNEYEPPDIDEQQDIDEAMERLLRAPKLPSIPTPTARPKPRRISRPIAKATPELAAEQHANLVPQHDAEPAPVSEAKSDPKQPIRATPTPMVILSSSTSVLEPSAKPPSLSNSVEAPPPPEHDPVHTNEGIMEGVGQSGLSPSQDAPHARDDHIYGTREGVILLDDSNRSYIGYGLLNIIQSPERWQTDRQITRNDVEVQEMMRSMRENWAPISLSPEQSISIAIDPSLLLTTLSWTTTEDREILIEEAPTPKMGRDNTVLVLTGRDRVAALTALVEDEVKTLQDMQRNHEALPRPTCEETTLYHQDCQLHVANIARYSKWGCHVFDRNRMTPQLTKAVVDGWNVPRDPPLEEQLQCRVDDLIKALEAGEFEESYSKLTRSIPQLEECHMMVLHNRPFLEVLMKMRMFDEHYLFNLTSDWEKLNKIIDVHAGVWSAAIMDGMKAMSLIAAPRDDFPSVKQTRRIVNAWSLSLDNNNATWPSSDEETKPTNDAPALVAMWKLGKLFYQQPATHDQTKRLFTTEVLNQIDTVFKNTITAPLLIGTVAEHYLAEWVVYTNKVKDILCNSAASLDGVPNKKTVRARLEFFFASRTKCAPMPLPTRSVVSALDDSFARFPRALSYISTWIEPLARVLPEESVKYADITTNMILAIERIARAGKKKSEAKYIVRHLLRATAVVLPRMESHLHEYDARCLPKGALFALAAFGMRRMFEQYNANPWPDLATGLPEYLGNIEHREPKLSYTSDEEDIANELLAQFCDDSTVDPMDDLTAFVREARSLVHKQVDQMNDEIIGVRAVKASFYDPYGAMSNISTKASLWQRNAWMFMASWMESRFALALRRPLACGPFLDLRAMICSSVFRSNNAWASWENIGREELTRSGIPIIAPPWHHETKSDIEECEDMIQFRRDDKDIQNMVAKLEAFSVLHSPSSPASSGHPQMSSECAAAITALINAASLNGSRRRFRARKGPEARFVGDSTMISIVPRMPSHEDSNTDDPKIIFCILREENLFFNDDDDVEASEDGDVQFQVETSEKPSFSGDDLEGSQKDLSTSSDDGGSLGLMHRSSAKGHTSLKEHAPGPADSNSTIQMKRVHVNDDRNNKQGICGIDLDHPMPHTLMPRAPAKGHEKPFVAHAPGSFLDEEDDHVHAANSNVQKLRISDSLTLSSKPLSVKSTSKRPRTPVPSGDSPHRKKAKDQEDDPAWEHLLDDPIQTASSQTRMSFDDVDSAYDSFTPLASWPSSSRTSGKKFPGPNCGTPGPSSSSSTTRSAPKPSVPKKNKVEYVVRRPTA